MDRALFDASQVVETEFGQPYLMFLLDIFLKNETVKLERKHLYDNDLQHIRHWLYLTHFLVGTCGKVKDRNCV